MSDSNNPNPSEKARDSYLENAGCIVVIIVGAVCSAAGTIMAKALETANAMAGALAVAALSAMGVGVTYFLFGQKKH